MDQQLAIKESKKEPATFSTLPEDLVPPIIGFIRRWAEKEELGEDFQERRKKGRKWVALLLFSCLLSSFSTD